LHEEKFEAMRGIRYTSIGVIIVSVTLLLFICCSKRQDQEIVPAGSPMARSIHFQFAIYYLPLPSGDPSAALNQLLAREYRKLKLVEEMREDPGELLVCAYVQNDIQTEYAPPDMESLQYFGRGLTRRQEQRLQKCEQAFILNFGHPKDSVWEGLRTANQVAEAIARKTGGLLWDEETRELFTPDEWHRKRIASWTESLPDISNHITIHAYKSDEYMRAITLGMLKIGLPDVVFEDFSWSMYNEIGHLINLFCQSMAEGAAFKEPGKFDLVLRSIKNQKVRKPQVESLKPHATGVAFLSLRKGKWEEGDPQNRLIEITFDRYPGRDVNAKQEEMLSSFFGWEDSVILIKHNNALLAASRNAKAKLAALYKAFTAELQPGEYILVKVPFETQDGGHEWMWVEVIAWQGDKIKGLLRNQPFNIPSLHSGQIVEVKQEDVFDYIRHYPDGKKEGNETSAIVEKMQQEK
jgi:uncharacterized protein YegJ (DUF2314 family)